ncbi:MAG: ABC transporter permease [Gemmatimonadota bacterium]
MRLLYRIIPQLRAIFRGRRVDADVADEIQFHIDRETDANTSRGMPFDEARRVARLTVGSVDDAMETARDQRPAAALRQIIRDLRFGIRLLAKSPAFAAAAVTVVALGIGAVTAIFSAVYGVMLQPLPFREPERLISIWTKAPTLTLTRMYPSSADVRDWRQGSHQLQDIALIRTTANFNLVGNGDAERIQGARFSPNVLAVLGVTPALGRDFRSDEDMDGHDRVVILSDGLWHRRFGGDSSILGHSIQLNGAPYTVIGVMPPSFQYPTRDFQAWVPLVLDPRERDRQVNQNYLAVGRLRANATVAQAQRELDVIATRLAMEHPATNRDRGVIAEPMLASAIRDVQPALVALLAASSCLLVIACLNLSNLLAARAAARSGELALRLALGASRQRLVAQAIAEVTPVLALGGMIGVAAAVFLVRAFVAAAPPNMPRLESISVSTPVILVSLAVLVVTGLLASVIPAMHAWRADFTTMSKDGGRSSTSGRRRADARRIGVAVQIAFAVPLLVGASLLVRSAIKLADVDLGFRRDRVATFHLAIPRSKYPSDPEVAAFYDRLLQAIAGLPGVEKAGMVNRLPLAGNQTMSISVEKASGERVDISSIDSRPATPGYFAAMGIALRSGRSFDARDDETGVPVAIVDDRLSTATWPGADAVGKRVQRFDGVWCTVIGVVAHIRANSVDVDPRPQVYWSHHQVTQDRVVLVVRTSGDARALIDPVGQAIKAIDPEQPVYDVRTMDTVVQRSLVQRRLTMMLIVAFGVIALILAAVGIYGVVAYGVTQRWREFGIRVALGATRSEVTRLVLREGITMALTGSVAGLVVAAALQELMSSLVFGIGALDVASLAAGPLALFAVAALASCIPAWRASAVDPAVTLRE